jgi:hypothetical protein
MCHHRSLALRCQNPPRAELVSGGLLSTSPRPQTSVRVRGAAGRDLRSVEAVPPIACEVRQDGAPIAVTVYWPGFGGFSRCSGGRCDCSCARRRWSLPGDVNELGALPHRVLHPPPPRHPSSPGMRSLCTLNNTHRPSRRQPDVMPDFVAPNTCLIPNLHPAGPDTFLWPTPQWSWQEPTVVDLDVVLPTEEVSPGTSGWIG